ncbi:hypothetical protein OROGR_000651 [Orobanche gracilis]
MILHPPTSCQPLISLFSLLIASLYLTTHLDTTTLLLTNKFGPISSTHILSFTAATTATVRNLDLDFLNNYSYYVSRHVAVVRSCNGLLLCRIASRYFICNPTTRKSTTLNLPKHQYKNQDCTFYLAFDPSTSPHYEIIFLRIWAGKPPFRCAFTVYSSKTRSWRETPSGVNFYAQFRLNDAAGVYSNRAIHWFDKADCSSGVYFHIDSRSLKTFPMPPLTDSDSDSNSVSRNVKYFGESGGCLHLILCIDQTLKLDVFELKEDYSDWSLIHNVDLNSARVKFPELSYWDIPNSVVPFYIACAAEGKNSALVLIVGGGTAVVLYDPVDRSSTKLCDLNPGTINVDLATGNVLGEVFQHIEYISDL